MAAYSLLSSFGAGGRQRGIHGKWNECLNTGLLTKVMQPRVEHLVHVLLYEELANAGLDFAERLLSQARDRGALSPPKER